MGGNKEDVGKEPQAVQEAPDTDISQGLSSKKVNYNLSNRRQLVGDGHPWHLASCTLHLQSCKAFCYIAVRNGLRDVYPGSALLCLDDRVGGKHN